MRRARWLAGQLLRPQVLLPVIFAVAILIGLLAFGNAPKILARMEHFQRAYLLYFLLLTLAYEAVRCFEWYFLLRALGLATSPRTAIFTFMVGEVTRDLPVGNFVPDYVLKRSQGTGFGLASSATLLTTLLEVAVCLAGVVIIGVGGWSWLRPVILVGLFAFALLLWAFYRWHHHPHRHLLHPRIQWALRQRVVRMAMEELRAFAQGEVTLMHPHVLGIGAALAACYLVLGGLGIFLIALGLGVGLPWYAALAVYFFSIAFAAIVPLPMDFGSVELSGTGALVAMGVGSSASVSMVLINRVLSFGAALAIAAVVLLVLSGEVRQALRSQAESISRETAVRAPD